MQTRNFRKLILSEKYNLISLKKSKKKTEISRSKYINKKGDFGYTYSSIINFLSFFFRLSYVKYAG